MSLEWFVEVSYPVAPALSSVLCWAGSQFLSAIFIIISEALEEGPNADPPYNMQRALIFQAVLALAAVPPALLLGIVGNAKQKRLQATREEEAGNMVRA